MIEVHYLANRVHPYPKGALHGQIHLQPLRADGVVDDADVDPGVLDPELLDDQHLQVVLDPLRRKDLSEA